MEVRELVSDIKRLEDDITVQVGKLVEQFKNKTGYTPTHITINLIDTRRMEDHRTQYMVGGCEVDIKL